MRTPFGATVGAPAPGDGPGSRSLWSFVTDEQADASRPSSLPKRYFGLARRPSRRVSPSPLPQQRLQPPAPGRASGAAASPSNPDARRADPDAGLPGGERMKLSAMICANLHRRAARLPVQIAGMRCVCVLGGKPCDVAHFGQDPPGDHRADAVQHRLGPRPPNSSRRIRQEPAPRAAGAAGRPPGLSAR